MRSSLFCTIAFLIVSLQIAQGQIPIVSWITQFGTNSLDESFGISVDSAGNSYVSGDTYGSLAAPNLGDGDTFVRKFDPAGNMLWTRQFGTNDLETGYDASQNSSGDAYVTGMTQGSLAGPSAGSYDAYIIKFDGSGNEQWRRQFGTTTNDFAFDIAVGPSGSAYLVGDTNGNLGGTNQGSTDAYLRKYDASGAEQWTRQLGTSFDDLARGVGSDQLGNWPAPQKLFHVI
jgi:large repetitive protein